MNLRTFSGIISARGVKFVKLVCYYSWFCNGEVFNLYDVDDSYIYEYFRSASFQVLYSFSRIIGW